MNVRFRVIVQGPPTGAHFAVQSGKDELLPPVATSSDELRFEFELRVQPGPDGRPNFLGPCAQGPRNGRFVYVNSGGRAGETGSVWDRRAKLSLMSIDWALLDTLNAQPGALLEGVMLGRAKDGGPACASVPVVGGWRVVTQTPPSTAG
jgi:hypothetical protein